MEGVDGVRGQSSGATERFCGRRGLKVWSGVSIQAQQRAGLRSEMDEDTRGGAAKVKC